MLRQSACCQPSAVIGCNQTPSTQPAAWSLAFVHARSQRRISTKRRPQTQTPRPVAVTTVPGRSSHSGDEVLERQQGARSKWKRLGEAGETINQAPRCTNWRSSSSQRCWNSKVVMPSNTRSDQNGNSPSSNIAVCIAEIRWSAASDGQVPAASAVSSSPSQPSSWSKQPTGEPFSFLASPSSIRCGPSSSPWSATSSSWSSSLSLSPLQSATSKRASPC
mmetsp:Transcript_116266/g.333890  ORF Transcript_116266/g.333890 Transcript_116266/m.333890 type:complete len:220 (-) Transcript_116266:284-943(-)